MRYFILSVFTFICANLFSQDTTRNPFYVGLKIGSGAIKGEISNYEIAPHLGVYVQKNIGPNFQVGIEFNRLQYLGNLDSSVSYGMHSGKAYTSKKNLLLTSRANQIGFSVGCDITPKVLRERNFRLAVHAGFGVANFASQLTFTDMRDSLEGWYSSGAPNPNYLRPITETYNGRHWYVPVGIEALYIMQGKYFAGIQFQAMHLRSDDIDVLNGPTSHNAIWDTPLNMFIKLGVLL